MTTVFWPTTLDGARRLRDAGQVTDVLAYAATGEVYRARELADDAEEDAAFWAQTLASVRSLVESDTGPRVVLAADVDDAAVRPRSGDLGAVTVDLLPWRRALAVFVDADEAADALAAARASLGGVVDVAVAWDSAAVADLVAEHDLAWYLPEEIGQI